MKTTCFKTILNDTPGNCKRLNILGRIVKLSKYEVIALYMPKHGYCMYVCVCVCI